jgi:hypothetical protein
MHYAARNRERDAMQDDSELLLQNARKSFMLAGEAPSSGDIARYAAMGRNYLELAHRAAKVDAADAGGADRDPPQRCHRGRKVPSMEPNLRRSAPNSDEVAGFHLPDLYGSNPV